MLHLNASGGVEGVDVSSTPKIVQFIGDATQIGKERQNIHANAEKQRREGADKSRAVQIGHQLMGHDRRVHLECLLRVDRESGKESSMIGYQSPVISHSLDFRCKERIVELGLATNVTVQCREIAK